MVRRHWGIENRCHWTLDMGFEKDPSNSQPLPWAESFCGAGSIDLPGPRSPVQTLNAEKATPDYA